MDTLQDSRTEGQMGDWREALEGQCNRAQGRDSSNTGINPHKCPSPEQQQTAPRPDLTLSFLCMFPGPSSQGLTEDSCTPAS